MKNFKRTLCILIITAFIWLPVSAQEGEYTNLKEGEIAPFEGILLSPQAMATIIAKKEFCEKEAKLDVGLQCNLDKEQIKKDKDLLKVERDTAIKEKNIVEEIKRLREIAEKSSRNLSPLFFAGGALGGIALSLGIFWITVQMTN